MAFEGLKFTALQDSTFSYSTSGPTSPDVKYSYDGNSWNQLRANTSISINKDQSVYIKGDNANGFSNMSNQTRFSFTGAIDISGDISSLLSNSDDVVYNIPCDACFVSLFGVYSSSTPAELYAHNLKLPATMLTLNCYASMFYSQTNLKTIPKELPALNIPQFAYVDMFGNCTGINENQCIDIKATSFENYCFSGMFENSSIQNIIIHFEEWPVIYPYAGWLKNVPENGKITCPQELDTSIRDEYHIPPTWQVSIPVFDADKIYIPKINGDISTAAEVQCILDSEGNILYGEPLPYKGVCFANAQDEQSSIKYINEYTNAPDVKYSTNGISWRQWEPNTPIYLNKEDKIYVKGDNPNGFTTTKGRTYFLMTGKIAGSGNIMSLLDNSDGTVITDIPNSECFCGLFCRNRWGGKNLNNSLVTCPDLNVTSIRTYCFQYLCSGCSELTEFPKIGPEFNCKGASSAFSNAFEYCTKIKHVTIDWILLNPTGNFENFLRGATSLETVNFLTSQLPGRGYHAIFADCINLKYVYMPNITSWSPYDPGTWSDPFGEWLSNVSPTGTFICNAELDATQRGIHRIPEGWEVYKQVDYLESTGTQYIDTGIPSTVNISTIELEGRFTELKSGNGLCGIQQSHYIGIGIVNSWSKFTYLFGNRGSISPDVSSVDLNKHYFYWHRDSASGPYEIRMDEQIKNVDKLDNSGNYNISFPLFATYNTSGSINAIAKCQINKASIFDYNNLIFNAIPAIRMSDLKPGMLDIADYKCDFHTNQGEGEFLYG